jgi:hypothetical protein
MLIALWVVVGSASGVARAEPLPPGSQPVGPSEILARYEASLSALRRPKTITFDYSVQQLGLRDMEQTHHVYRSGVAERDETLIVDGIVLPRPAVRIIANRSDRYDIIAVAPTAAAYEFEYTGSRPAGNDMIYVFRTQRRAPASFAVSEIELDSRRFLPRVVHFKIGGYGARGSGALLYGPADAYWVIRQAHVNAHLTSGAPAHERITWSNYQFPPSLPHSTFEAPRAVAPLEPDVLPTETPEASQADPNAP